MTPERAPDARDSIHACLVPLRKPPPPTTIYALRTTHHSSFPAFLKASVYCIEWTKWTTRPSESRKRGTVRPISSPPHLPSSPLTLHPELQTNPHRSSALSTSAVLTDGDEHIYTATEVLLTSASFCRATGIVVVLVPRASGSGPLIVVTPPTPRSQSSHTTRSDSTIGLAL